MITLVSNSIDNTKSIAKKIAPYLKKGDTIVFTGDLGAGKTVFVSGILSYFGKENETSSPTFTIINEHNVTDKIKIFHFDVYRFDFEDEFLAIGGDEFFDKGICLIEWGEKIQNYLPNEYIKVVIHKDTEDENKRIFEFISIGEKYNTLLSEVFNKYENFSN